MYIDKYKQSDGWYKEDDGCEHETARDFIQCGILGHCGCGVPDDSLIFIKDQLIIIEKGYPFDVGFTPLQYTLWYMFDKYGLTEHGTSLPGWLTQKGEELLSDLRELYATQSSS